MIPLILAALGAAGAAKAIGGSIQANQERQRQKGIIGRAYAQGQQRLNLRQQDTRQSFGEGLLARGLGGAGGVRDTGAVGVGGGGDVTGAHDLGSQGVADLRREQGLEQTDLATQRDVAYSDTNAEATSGIINSIAGGIGTALGGVNMGQMASAGKADPVGAPSAGISLGGSANDRYPGAAFGVDPVNPLGRGAWSTPTAGSTGGASSALTNADFNVTGGLG